MTTSELLARAWSALDDDSTDHQRYPAATLVKYLRDGAWMYLARTRGVHNVQTLTQTPYTALYELPGECLAVTRIEWNNAGTYYPVSPTTMRELDERMSRGIGWETQTGTRAEWYWIFGLNQIGLFPLITSGTESYVVHYIVAAALTTDTDLYGVPDEDHEGLVNYVVARCLGGDKKAKEAMDEYAKYVVVVKGAQARRSSSDRLWSMANKQGWQGIDGSAL